MHNKYLRKLRIKPVDGKFENPTSCQVRDPEQAYKVFQALKDREQETFIGIHLTADLQPILYDVLGVGKKPRGVLLPEKVFGRAFISQAKYLIIIHNRSSGDATPSRGDEEAIELLSTAATILKKVLLDFIIVSNNSYWSMFEEQGLDSLAA